MILQIIVLLCVAGVITATGDQHPKCYVPARTWCVPFAISQPRGYLYNADTGECYEGICGPFRAQASCETACAASFQEICSDTPPSNTTCVRPHCFTSWHYIPATDSCHSYRSTDDSTRNHFNTELDCMRTCYRLNLGN